MSQMNNRNEFLFIGGDPALDFLNTEAMRDGEPVDLLDSPASLSRWIAEAGLGSHERVTLGVLREVKRFRAAFRNAVLAVIAGKRPSLRAVNDELKRGVGTLVMKGSALEFEPKTRDPRFLIARAAATFLATASADRIHRCGGTNCILFFYDATKSGTRRWCSMAGCGNRMKASLHYQRKRGLLG
jgi:predicted RNA-binding Zn ribbon-like protein